MKLLNNFFVYIYREHRKSIREKHMKQLWRRFIWKSSLIDYVSAQLIIVLVERKIGVLIKH